MDSELQESNQQFAIEIIRQMACSMQDNTTLAVMLRVKSLIDEMIKIPMFGEVESLNAAVACSILMYEAARQRRGSGPGVDK